MPRAIRAVAVGVPHHITQRGNGKQDVFFSDEERVRYLGWLTEYSRRYAFDMLAYCLMTTHVHIVGIPHNEIGMGRTIQMTHMRHTQAVNFSQERTGHLWQGRYFSTILDEKHLYMAIRYVEQNPVRAKMVERAEEYPWSSAACHCGLREDLVLCNDPKWNGLLDGWPELLGHTQDEQSIDELRTCTSSGKPCGDEEFVKGVSEIVGRSLERRPRGRPKLHPEETIP